MIDNYSPQFQTIREQARGIRDAEERAIYINGMVEVGNITQEEANYLQELFSSQKAHAKSIGEREMITLRGLKNLPAKRYVMRRLELSQQCLCLLCGTGNSGKSMFLQYLAVCVSSGEPFFGTFPVTRGKVVHIDQEQAKTQTQRRYERLAAAMSLDSLNIERVKLANRLDSGRTNPREVEQELTDLFQGASLIIIDSLKAVSEADENSADIEVVLKMLKRVAEQTDTCVLLCHHKGKGKSDVKQSGRGHSSIYDSVDVQIDLDCANDVFELWCSKNRDGKFFDGMKYNVADLGEYVEDQNCTEELHFQLLQQDVKAKKDDRRGRILEELTKGERKHSELYEVIRGDRNTLNDLLQAMVLAQEIEETKGAKNSRLFRITEKGKGALNY